MNKRCMIAGAGLGFALLALAGCHHDTRPYWARAQAQPHLNVPSGVDTPGHGDEMLVPSAGNPGAGEQGDDALVASSMPPVQVLLTSDEGVPAVRELVASRLDENPSISILGQGAGANGIATTILGSQLPEADNGFWWGLFHEKPDPKRAYRAHVAVVSRNAETRVEINGDGRAVMYLSHFLQGPQLVDAAAREEGVSVPLLRPNLRSMRNSQRGEDASGRPMGRPTKQRQ